MSRRHEIRGALACAGSHRGRGLGVRAIFRPINEFADHKRGDL
jgi:hypothetical protein